MVNIALVGLGYWGPNLARNFVALPEATLHTLCDTQTERLERLGRQYPSAKQQTSFEAVLADPTVEAVVIATPVQTHFDLALAALQAGKHVLVEKPLAQTTRQCQTLIAAAATQKVILMAGHVFLYNAAVRKVKEYIESGELGEIYYVYSQRLNLGIIRQDVNALWNFAPHDLSIINYWLGAAPESVTARGYSYLQPGIEDVVFITLDFPGGIGANVHISWLDPNKVRRMTVVGSHKMVVYDDVSADAKVMVYDRGFTKKPNDSSLGRYESFGEFQLLLRAGDIIIPKIDFVEPLKLECSHFIECIKSGNNPLSDGYDGLRVVQVLEAAQQSLKKRTELAIKIETQDVS
jgi:predicted dehydrogenase